MKLGYKLKERGEKRRGGKEESKRKGSRRSTFWFDQPILNEKEQPHLRFGNPS
jgi:hypothetical protein